MSTAEIVKRNKDGTFKRGFSFSPKTQFKKGIPSPRKGVRKPGWKNQTSFKPRRALWEANVREYQRVHRWIIKEAGQPKYCESCKSIDKNVYHWANVSHKYIENRSDWIRLCAQCHKNYDQYEIQLNRIADLILRTHFNGGLVMICGNGGSSAMSSHFSAELLGKFEKDRKGIRSICLSDNPVLITAVANDYGFQYIFSRQVETFSDKENLLICLTTSDVDELTGHSMNLFEASKMARKKKMKQVIIGSKSTVKLTRYFSPNACLRSKGHDTASIQDSQLRDIHMICRLVENKL